MPRTDETYVLDMLLAARRAHQFVTDSNRADFARDEKLQLSLTYLIQIIGEVARHISEETRALAPSIPWWEIAGMRNRIVHEYLSVDLDEVWTTATRDIPILIGELETLTARLQEQSQTGE